MQEIRSSNRPVVTGICDSNKSQARHHCNLQQLKIRSLISLLADKICKKTNVHTAGHSEREQHLFIQNQRLKEIPSQKFLTDLPIGL